MPTLGAPELIVILVILVLLFGGSRLGSIGGALGKTIREFRREMKDDEPAAAKPVEAKPAETKPEDKIS
jgi:sec-independent protein translocase protein TatA